VQKTTTFITLYAGYKLLKCVYVRSNTDKMEEKLTDLKISEEKSAEDQNEDFQKELDKSENPEALLESLKLLSDPEATKKMGKKELRYLQKLEKLRTKKKISATNEAEKNFTFSTSLEIFGTVRENINKEKDGFQVEFHIESLRVCGDMAPSFPVAQSSDAFTKLENGHLYLRLPERRLYLKARSHLMRLIRDFYYTNEYTEVAPPTLVQSQVEGGSTLFTLDYYGSPAYLTQSSQLYLETAVPVAMKAFCSVQSYRAEKSNTRRHLSEYVHVEAELADVEFKDLLDSIEGLVTYVASKFYKDMAHDIKEVYPDFKAPEISKFIRMTYKEGIEFLREQKYLNEDKKMFEVGDDIPDAAERFMVDSKGAPILLTNFLIEHKPFYMKRSKEHAGTTESCDLLFPGVGEIVGGSMRTESSENLVEGFVRENIPQDPYYWYIDMLKYGPSSHGGYGLGFERLLMALMKYDSINMATLYPRFVNRCFDDGRN